MEWTPGSGTGSGALGRPPLTHRGTWAEFFTLRAPGLHLPFRGLDAEGG